MSRLPLAPRRVLLSIVAMLITLGISAPAFAVQEPPPGGGHCSINCWANYVEFQDGGTNSSFLYYYNLAKHDGPVARHLDFSTDGCSVPSALINALAKVRYKIINPHLDRYAKTYATFFYKSCRIHDIGYRNFGKGPYTVTMGDSSDPRKSVDDRLDHNMHRQCGSNPPSIPLTPDAWACNRVAGLFYEAVRKFAASHW